MSVVVEASIKAMSAQKIIPHGRNVGEIFCSVFFVALGLSALLLNIAHITKKMFGGTHEWFFCLAFGV